MIFSEHANSFIQRVSKISADAVLSNKEIAAIMADPDLDYVASRSLDYASSIIAASPALCNMLLLLGCKVEIFDRLDHIPRWLPPLLLRLEWLDHPNLIAARSKNKKRSPLDLGPIWSISDPIAYRTKPLVDGINTILRHPLMFPRPKMTQIKAQATANSCSLFDLPWQIPAYKDLHAIGGSLSRLLEATDPYPCPPRLIHCRYGSHIGLAIWDGIGISLHSAKASTHAMALLVCVSSQSFGEIYEHHSEDV